jgi:hypothetical protein
MRATERRPYDGIVLRKLGTLVPMLVKPPISFTLSLKKWLVLKHSAEQGSAEGCAEQPFAKRYLNII